MNGASKELENMKYGKLNIIVIVIFSLEELHNCIDRNN